MYTLHPCTRFARIIGNVNEQILASRSLVKNVPIDNKKQVIPSNVWNQEEAIAIPDPLLADTQVTSVMSLLHYLLGHHTGPY